MNKSDFEIVAQVLLPNHFHMIIDPMKNDISSIMQKIKMSYGMFYRRTTSLRSGRVWQHRYWDHIIRNQDDMNRHIDYIHFNPVKHNFVRNPFDWEHSTIHEYKKNGMYSDDWGVTDQIKIDGNFGE